MGRGRGNNKSTQGTSRRGSRNNFAIDWSRHDFSHCGVDYETEIGYSGGPDEFGINRSTTINSIEITEVDRETIAFELLKQMQDDQRWQAKAIKRFLSRKAGKPFKGKSDSVIFAEYSKEQQRINQEKKERNKRAWRDMDVEEIHPILSKEEMERSFDDVDRLAVEAIINHHALDQDDFEVPVVQGYYGEETSGVYMENASKAADINYDLQSYMNAQSKEEKMQWLSGYLGNGEINVTSVREEEIPLQNIDNTQAIDTDEVEKYRALFDNHRDDGQNVAVVAVDKDYRPIGSENRYTVVIGANALTGAANAQRQKVNVFVIE